MSKFSDDSLGTVVNYQTDGASRATTPQMKLKQRKRTPQRAGSAPRSSSANKVCGGGGGGGGVTSMWEGHV